MNNNLRIGMAQINPILGDFDGNTRKIIDYLKRATRNNIDLVVFPELSISGYPPLDLLFQKSFVKKNLDYLHKIASNVPDGMVVILGFVDETKEGLRDAAAFIQNGSVDAVRYKTLLPNYDVFDEGRYFVPAHTNSPVILKNKNGQSLKIGIEICEDLWDISKGINVTDDLVSQGCKLIVNISASPFTEDKREMRKKLILDKVRRLRVPFVYVNMVGGQDELVFDGNSIAYSVDQKVVCWSGEFTESLKFFDIDPETGLSGSSITLSRISREESIYNALVTGVRDYLGKSGFSKAVIGLSGGIDSALVSCIAVDALGAENVLCVSMPSRFTSNQSIKDTEKLTNSLKVKYKVIPIENIVQSYEENLAGIFGSLPRGTTEENIQARVRGNILMAVSNKFNYIVLSTGNKTELALGYCTLYGDMTGGLAVISDVSKSDVYALSNYVNKKAGRNIIPQSIINKIPSAELKEDQVDPFEYKIVSPLVDYIIKEGKSKMELIKMGFSEALVKNISERIRNAEYKRRQAPPGIKISEKAFGLGRRFPIINHYNE